MSNHPQLPALPPNDNKIYTAQVVNGNVRWHDTGTTVDASIPSPTPAPVVLRKLMLLVAGQSNSCGSSLEFMPQADYATHPRIKQLTRGKSTTYKGEQIWYDAGVAGQIIPAQNPLQSHGITAPQSVGFALYFARQYVRDHPDVELTIVHGGLGGSSFTGMTLNSGTYHITWDSTRTWAAKNLALELWSDANTVLDAHPDMRVLGMLWHQGESDTGNAQYPSLLSKFLVDTRAKLRTGRGAETMPIVTGTMLKSWRMLNSQTEFTNNSSKWIGYFVGQIKPEQQAITDCADFDHITGAADDNMSVHFTGKGLKLMGDGYYTKFNEITARQTSRSLFDEHMIGGGGSGARAVDLGSRFGVLRREIVSVHTADDAAETPVDDGEMCRRIFADFMIQQ